jgi:hypothetical protein
MISEEIRIETPTVLVWVHHFQLLWQNAKSLRILAENIKKCQIILFSDFTMVSVIVRSKVNIRFSVKSSKLRISRNDMELYFARSLLQNFQFYAFKSFLEFATKRRLEKYIFQSPSWKKTN